MYRQPATIGPCILLVLVWSLVAEPFDGLAGEPLQVGYAEVDITPPPGTSMPGGFRDRKATGVLDPLLAKVLVLQLGGPRVALVACDLLALEATEVALIREEVERRTNIPAGQVWVHCTHTHAGGMFPRRFTSDAVELGVPLYEGDVDAVWLNRLPGRIAGAAAEALRSASEETAVTLSKGRAEGIAFYRRFWMTDGTLRTNPGRGNPRIDRPAGEVDSRVFVVRFPTAKTLLVNFALHPAIVTGTEFSADYPAHLTATIREALGPEWNVLFLNGFSGNVNHIDVTRPDQLSGDAEARRVGRVLGEAVLAALDDNATPLEIDRLAIASRQVECRLRQVPDSVRENAESLLAANDPSDLRGDDRYAPAVVLLSRTRDKTHRAEIAALRLGPLALVAMPGEIFLELGQEVQANSPQNPTLTVNLTNGSMGYIPTAEAYDQGGYEASYRSARYAPDTGHHWARAAGELLNELAE